MYYPNREEFKKKAEQGNLIPVYKEILADLETPVSAYLKIEKGKHAFLLESVEQGEKLGRYSFLGADPSIIFKSFGDKITIIKDGAVEEKTGDPLLCLKELMQGFKSVEVEGLPRFYGGAVGYISYDYVRFIEEIPDENPDDLGLPTLFFMVTDSLLVFDHLDHTIKVVANAYLEGDADQAYDKACARIEGIIEKLAEPLRLTAEDAGILGSGSRLESNFTKEDFEKAVVRAKEYIKAGDIFQVVPSQRFKQKISKEPFYIYRMLRRVNPSPYMFYLKLDDLQVIGSSPEILVRAQGREVELRPIAGTRPRGENEAEDQALIKELLADPKERAEHIMLVDLGRNDIGRVCEYESINYPELMVIEKYSHVMHIASSIKGRLRDGKDAFDLLRAVFPAGTVSGAPKIRAMEIIDELEPARRGPYAGCVGYFSFSGNLDSCIIIRTILVKDGVAYVQSGAGIVADSDPEKEYYETMSKAKAMIKAIELAEGRK
ncbi:anthranilate synthase component I [bacterium]|nr:anthranilate synthase component I [bacterium]MBU1614365.1 anthranilate synthase component I [bacterium]